MSLTVSTIKQRCHEFSKKFANVTSETQEKQTFYNDFFAIFDKSRFECATFEKAVNRLPGKKPGQIDLLWARYLLVEHKSAGKDLDDADIQADEYYAGLDNGIKPRYILTCDYKHFRLRDLEKPENNVRFTLDQLAANSDSFNFMLCREREEREEQVNVEAAKLMDDIYKAMKASKYSKKHMGQYLTRLAYCMFAEDAGVFNNDLVDGKQHLFTDLIKNATDENDLGAKLQLLFQVLNTPVNERQDTLDRDLQKFPYVNGGLFKDTLPICSFTKVSRKKIIKAANYDWRHVSPAVFGSMFEGIMDKKKRRESGSHHTSEANVRKVINPLILDKLNAELDDILCSKTAGTRKRLVEFQKKISKLKFLDPACGSGSFLITTYQELRKLELDAIRILYPDKRLDKSTVLSKVNVDQFYGIELDEFAARITETAMWMVDHLMNTQLAERYEGNHTRIPLKKQANIFRGDALEKDWSSILDPSKCSYVIGNPPFLGSATMDKQQKQQTISITGSSKLDYVSNWFVKAANYINPGTDIGFVSTNSITNGEQVPLLWTTLKKRGVRIKFAYKSFLWGSDATKSASVTVVIVGLTKDKKIKPVIYNETTRVDCKHITPYLFASSKPVPMIVNNSVVKNSLPKLTRGSAIGCGPNYIFDEDEYNAALKNYPDTKASFFKQYMDGKSLLSNKKKYVLDVMGVEKSDWGATLIQERVHAVREFRLLCESQSIIEKSMTPESFTRRSVPSERFMVLSRHSSENREYLPIVISDPGIVPSEAVNISEPANMGVAALLTSRIHMLWVKAVAGRLADRIRYSNDTYETFPTPDKPLDSLAPLLDDILNIRNEYGHMTLQELYKQNNMPGELKKAHAKLDAAVEKLYRPKPFNNDDERLEFLFDKYSNAFLQVQAEKTTKSQKRPKGSKKSPSGKKSIKEQKIDEFQLELF